MGIDLTLLFVSHKTHLRFIVNQLELVRQRELIDKIYDACKENNCLKPK